MLLNRIFPGVAKFGIALEWGSRGRWFESSHSDHESPQSMIQSAEDFSILLMKKPCVQRDSGTLGVQMPSGVPLFCFEGINWCWSRMGI